MSEQEKFRFESQCEDYIIDYERKYTIICVILELFCIILELF